MTRSAASKASSTREYSSGSSVVGFGLAVSIVFKMPDSLTRRHCSSSGMTRFPLPFGAGVLFKSLRWRTIELSRVTRDIDWRI